MSREEQIREVAGELNAAGHCLRRATETAGRFGMTEEMHGLAQLQFAVQASAKGWNARSRRMTGDSAPTAGSRRLDGPSEGETLARLSKGPGGRMPPLRQARWTEPVRPIPPHE